jgi:sugar transferase EpsL
MLKRTFDVVVTVLAMPLWLPLAGVVALVVRMRLGSPVFFRQARGGLGGGVIRILKFRTMTEDRDDDGQLLPDAQRLTRLGTLLRSSSLDELPSLFNVLLGDLSLVGPRPLIADYLPLYNLRQARRHEVRPGITGWAQVNGRNSLSWEEKFELDVWYVDNRNLWLDIRILFMTVKRVFMRDGINAQNNATMPRFTGSK